MLARSALHSLFAILGSSATPLIHKLATPLHNALLANMKCFAIDCVNNQACYCNTCL